MKISTASIRCLAFLTFLLLLNGCIKSGSESTSTDDDIVGVGIPTDVMVYHSAEQHSQNWCWAASAQMALSTQGLAYSQEAIVRDLFGSLVDKPGGSPEFLGVCGKYTTPNGTIHINLKYGNGPPPLAFLIDSLQQQRPVILACENPGVPIGHAVVATAVIYQETPTGRKLIRILVRDPAPGSGKRILEAREFQNVIYYVAYNVTKVVE